MSTGATILLTIVVYFFVSINIDTWLRVKRIEKALNGSEEEEENK